MRDTCDLRWTNPKRRVGRRAQESRWTVFEKDAIAETKNVFAAGSAFEATNRSVQDDRLSYRILYWCLLNIERTCMQTIFLFLSLICFKYNVTWSYDRTNTSDYFLKYHSSAADLLKTPHSVFITLVKSLARRRRAIFFWENKSLQSPVWRGGGGSPSCP